MFLAIWAASIFHFCHKQDSFYGGSCIDTVTLGPLTARPLGEKKTWLATVSRFTLLLFFCVKQWHLINLSAIEQVFPWVSTCKLGKLNSARSSVLEKTGSYFRLSRLYHRLARRIQNPRRSKKCYIIININGGRCSFQTTTALRASVSTPTARSTWQVQLTE